MTPHAHTWTLVNAALRRYRCDCGVIGHALVGRRGIVPYKCQYELDGRVHCSAPATQVGWHATHNRCAEHINTASRARHRRPEATP